MVARRLTRSGRRQGFEVPSSCLGSAARGLGGCARGPWARRRVRTSRRGRCGDVGSAGTVWPPGARAEGVHLVYMLL